MKKKIESAKKIVGKVILLTSIFMMNAQVCYAKPTPTPAAETSITGSRVVTGTQNLFSDFSKALLAIIPIITAPLIIYNLIKLQPAEDEGEAKPIKKRIKTILICAIVGEIASALVTIILSYYK